MRCLLGTFVGLSIVPVAAAVRAPTPAIPWQAGDGFQDVTAAAGIGFVHQFCHSRIANILLSNGAGAAVLDYDGDGWMDLYLLNWGPLEGVTDSNDAAPREPNRLYRNLGNGTFADVTESAGVAGRGFASAAAVGDIDNDGDPDLFVACIGRSLLYRNRGDGTFEECAARAGVDHPGTGIAATFLDFDRDGRLDLFQVNYLRYVPAQQSEQNPGAYPGPLAYAGEPNVLYRNRGDGTFEDVTRAAGLLVPGQRGMGVSAFDCDWDGDTDLYICNDDTPNMLFVNDGQGHFRDVAPTAGVAFNSLGEAPGSMQATVADANGDGWPDLFVTRLGYGSLYLRSPEGLYDDRMFASGLGQLTQRCVGWGGVFLDFENDGDEDLALATGSAFTIEGTLPLLLLNDGRGRFTDGALAGGKVFGTKINARGTVTLDFDRDGRTDLLFTALADRPWLLRNRGPATNHWLTLQLQGTRSNRSGYGALLTVEAGGRTHRREALCPTGFLSQGDPRPHFGLGAARQVDRLQIRWPSGAVQTLTNLPADQILSVQEPSL